MSFLKTFSSTLGTALFHLLHAAAAESLIADKTVVWVSHETETDKASQSLLEKLFLVIIVSVFPYLVFLGDNHAKLVV